MCGYYFFLAEYKFVKEKSVSCPYKIKKCLLSQSLYLLHTMFFFFGRTSAYKDSKLGIMTNMGKSRLAKVIFNNIHKINDSCANSFDRYIMIAQCMRSIFIFY